MGDKSIIKISAPDYRAFWKLPVLFEGGGLLALEKPAHVLVSPEKQRADDPVLTKLLQRDLARKAAWTQERDYSFLDLIYTLDLETTGVILFATDKAVFEGLRNDFGARQMESRFTALAHGIPEEDQFETDLKMAPHPAREWEMRINRTKGKQSLTQFRVAERFRSCSLLECTSSTLRPHQVRVHLQHQGFPVVGDSLYGGELLMLSQIKRKYRSKRDTPEKPLLDRSAIHLSKLKFTHPGTQEAIEIESPLATDMTVALKFLRQFSR